MGFQPFKWVKKHPLETALLGIGGWYGAPMLAGLLGPAAGEAVAAGSTAGAGMGGMGGMGGANAATPGIQGIIAKTAADKMLTGPAGVGNALKIAGLLTGGQEQPPQAVPQPQAQSMPQTSSIAPWMMPQQPDNYESFAAMFDPEYRRRMRRV